jgi:hypothetical protein
MMAVSDESYLPTRETVLTVCAYEMSGKKVSATTKAIMVTNKLLTYLRISISPLNNRGLHALKAVTITGRLCPRL